MAPPRPARPSRTESAVSLSEFSRNHCKISWHGVLQGRQSMPEAHQAVSLELGAKLGESPPCSDKGEETYASCPVEL